MRIALRAAAHAIDGARWTGWARVACVALCGFWFYLFSPVALSQSGWPAASPTYWQSSCSSSTPGPASDCICAPHGGVSSYAPAVTYPVSSTGGACAAEGVTYLLYVNWSCPAGSSPDSTGACVNTACASDGGNTAVFDVKVLDNGQCQTRPDSVCLTSNCRAVVINASCEGTPLSSPPVSFWSGTAQSVTSGPCQQSDPLATTRVAASSNPGISGGGDGVVSGSGTASADSVNIARTATNTSRIADALISGSGSGSSCGGVGQPNCGVSVDEGNTATSGQAAQALQNGDISGMETAINGQISGMNLNALPTFDDGGSKWVLSFLPFLDASGPLDCKVEFEVPGHADWKAGYNFCGFADYVKAVLYWVFAVGTVLGIWNMVYSGNRGD